MRLVVLSLLLLTAGFAAGFSTSGSSRKYLHNGPQPLEVQTIAFRNLTIRVLGATAAANITAVLSKDSSLANRTDQYSYFCANGQLQINATSGTAAGAALHHYMRHYLNSSVTWGTNRSGWNIQIPATGLPATSGTVNKTTLGGYRYYMNVCTLGYTMAFWEWWEWEQHLDWMALHGINLPLASVGSEYVWWKTWTKHFNFTTENVTDYFTGPAFLPWLRMGNIHRWAGPMSVSFMHDQAMLQKQLLQRMTELGMSPILPAFDGHVPNALKSFYPTANISRADDWLPSTGQGTGREFSENYLLYPNDPLFPRIASAFMDELSAEYGTADFYNADTWNEMQPPTGDHSFLHNSSQAVYAGLTTHNPNAVWIMQGWLFLEGFWTDDRIQAYLSGAPHYGQIILDLTSDLYPQFIRTQGYFGHQFIWCMLHNYGGRRGIYGDMATISSSPVNDAASYPSMVGTGLTMEAIDQNIAIYELMLEMAWESQVKSSGDLDRWVMQYGRARYGNGASQNATMALIPMMHNNGPMEHMVPCCLHFTTLIMRPWINNGPHQGWDAWIAYTPDTVVESLLTVLPDVTAGATSTSSTFRYDAIDIARQVLSNMFTDYQNYITHMVYSSSTTVEDLRHVRDVMLTMITDLDRLMSSDANFLFGRWVEMAKKLTPPNSTTQESMLRFNAKAQVTVWGPDGVVHDYAGKPWGALLSTYHYQRWSYFFDKLEAAWNQTHGVYFQMSHSQYAQEIYENVEEPFTLSPDEDYPTQPTHDAQQEILSIVANWTAPFTSDNVTIMTDTASQGNMIMQAWHTNPNILYHLCARIPRCAAFDNNANLYDSNQTGAQPGSTLYVLNNTTAFTRRN